MEHPKYESPECEDTEDTGFVFNTSNPVPLEEKTDDGESLEEKTDDDNKSEISPLKKDLIIEANNATLSFLEKISFKTTFDNQSVNDSKLNLSNNYPDTFDIDEFF